MEFPGHWIGKIPLKGAGVLEIGNCFLCGKTFGQIDHDDASLRLWRQCFGIFLS